MPLIKQQQNKILTSVDVWLRSEMFN